MCIRHSEGVHTAAKPDLISEIWIAAVCMPPAPLQLQNGTENNIQTIKHLSNHVHCMYFRTVKWNYCILDEGHIIKNGRTKLSKAIKQLTAANRLILSGTPIQVGITPGRLESCLARLLASRHRNTLLSFAPTQTTQKIVNFMALTPDRPEYILLGPDWTETSHCQPEMNKFQTTTNAWICPAVK